jgi:hypothetical protein
VIALLLLPFRLVALGARIGAVLAWFGGRTARFIGLRRLALVALGVAIGLLLAPVPGAELRRRIGERLGELGGRPPVDLAERVREELAASPRTWHLPQPAVVVESGTVVLTGEVPHATAAADLARTVAGMKGVVEVDNRLTVKGP